jgi:hypothetical protein
MREAVIRQQRKAMLHLPHVAKLTEFAAELRRRGFGVVPEFDPMDGGVHAQILFLFEKPGPKTDEANGGSGFISRNNDDSTAEATFQFMEIAKIPRRATAIWNVVPWWNGTRKITRQELIAGTESVRDLIALLPCLRAVVMVGLRATRARPYLETTRLTLFTSHHPSPLVRASARQKWDAIPFQWAEAMALAR